MYQELNKQFLISELDFNQSKTLTLINIQCAVCENIFQQTKHQVKTNYARSKSKKFYCSSQCLSDGTNTRQITQCGECNKEIVKLVKEIKKSKSGHSFCNASCAATYNNKFRTQEDHARRVAIIRQKHADGLIQYKSQKDPDADYIKITSKAGYVKQYKIYKNICAICNNEFNSKHIKTKTCSKKCLSKQLSKIHLLHPHVILNRSNPESYLEKSFREFIENNKYIKNENFFQDKWFKINDKIYFADFYFPELNLIIELDR